MKVCAIVAYDESRVIGVKGGLPWRIPEDMKHFSSLTSGHGVLMGRKTYESLPEKFRPLPNRKNIVITRHSGPSPFPASVETWDSPVSCIQAYREGKRELPGGILWVIGGEQIYRATQALWDEVFVTEVAGSHQGDAYFPEFTDAFQEVERESFSGYSFVRFVRR